MSALPSLEFCYLVLLPYSSSLQGEGKGSLASPKGAPYFYDTDIQVDVLPTKTVTVEGVSVQVTAQVFDEKVWIAACRYSLASPEDEKKVYLNSQIQEGLKKLFTSVLDPDQLIILEEYTVIFVDLKDEKPDQFVDHHAKILANFVRGSYDKPLDSREIKDILSTRIRYSEQDLVVIDWNGAIIVTDEGDFQSDLDLLKIGNYQLMRYRMLDATIADILIELKKIVSSKKRIAWPHRERFLQSIISQRLDLLMSFEKLDQSLLLIGDWYSSQLYEAIVNELYLNDWKNAVQNKLDSLGSIHEVITQNLTISWQRIIEFVTFIGWFVMMIGYFVLFYLDFRHR